MNPLLATDSYKASHWTQYPPGADSMFSYIEARSSKTYPATVFFGLQAIIQKYLTTRITMEHVLEAQEFFQAHGLPFNLKGWMKIVNVYGGYLPVRISAVEEGMVVPAGNVLVSVEMTVFDREIFWVVSYIETLLLRVWYPTTVATKSYMAKQVIAKMLERTADDLSGLPFKLHDFGARGATCGEAAEMGGMAHLVNFMGSDTVEGVFGAIKYYPDPDIRMPGFSIPAGEHSTYTSWGRENEAEAYRNMLEVYGGDGKMFAAVSDSYDIYNALENIWGGELREAVINSGATVVVRPDSGDPTEVIPRCLDILDEKFGSTVNSKGYKVLNHVRIIWGDGIDDEMVIAQILAHVEWVDYSTDNLAFGMGGGLLQKLNRDTMGFAMKCSSIRINGQWRDVYKDPATQPGKKSKRGRLALVRKGGSYSTIGEAFLGDTENQLKPVYENGELLRKMTLGEVRRNTNAVFVEESVSEELTA